MEGIMNRDIDMRYPPSIVKWELEHGIVRTEKDGVMYISITDMDALNAQLLFEEEEHMRNSIRRRVAEEQEAAYLGK